MSRNPAHGHAAPVRACRIALVARAGLLAALLAAAVTVRAAPLAFQTWSVRDGLALSQVRDIHQDRRGFIWAATLGGGVSRFDGVRFETFTVADGLADNTVRALAEDGDGNVWFGTVRGISLFDGGRIVQSEALRALGRDVVLSLFRDASSRMWIGTERGLFIYDGASLREITGADGAPVLGVRAMAEEGGGRVWLGAATGLWRVDGTVATRVDDAGALPSALVRSLLLDRDGMLWIGTHHGLARFDGARVTPFPATGDVGGIRDLLQSSRGALWIATDSGGLLRYRDGHLDRFTRDHGLGSDEVWSLLEDGTGGIWAGTYRGGLSRKSDSRFVHLTTDDGLGDNVVRSVAQDESGDLLIGTYRGGLNRYDGASFDALTTRDGLPSDFVLTTLRDSRQRLWIGTFDGLAVLDGDRRRVITRADGLGDNVIRFLLEDRFGNLWIGTNAGGVSRYDGATIETYTTGDGLNDDGVMSLAEGADGDIWLATERGVNRFDGVAWQDMSETLGVADLRVNVVMRDASDALWFGTDGRGIVRYSESDGVTRFDRRHRLGSVQVQSLQMDGAGRLWVGSDKGLYLLEDALNAKGRRFRHFGPEQGFVGIECVHNAATQSADGRVWFGTIDGLTGFDPEALAAATNTPRVHISGVGLLQESTDILRYADGYERVTGLPEHLQLPHDQPHLTINFRGLSFDAPRSLRYRYRLAGTEGGWSPLNDSNQVHFAQLDPGDYRFDVVAVDHDGLNESDPASFLFTVETPYWQTWWFRLAAGMTILLLALAGARIIVTQIAARKTRERLEGLVRERTAQLADTNDALRQEMVEKENLETELLRVAKLDSLGVMAGGIAHDFNNLLTAILGNLSLLRVTADNPDDPDMRLAQAEKAAERARDLTAQLQSFARVEPPSRRRVFDIGSLVRETAQFSLTGLPVRCRFEIEQTLWPVDGDEGQIGQLVQNLVLNAAEASPDGGAIRVSCRNLDSRDKPVTGLAPGHYVEIRVDDAGQGIPEKDLPRIFDPYFTTKPNGTGLGLAMAHATVRRHNGRITVSSDSRAGTCFTVILPAVEKSVTSLDKDATTLRLHDLRVLVVDDEESVLDTTCGMLAAIGCVAQGATEGTAAVELYRQALEAGQPYDTVILDLTMVSGMSGLETLETLRELDPGVKAVVSSGYSDDPVMTRFRDYGFRGSLPKPYFVRELSAALSEVNAAPLSRADVASSG